MTRGPLNGISRGPMNKMQTTPVWWATFMLFGDDDDFDDVNDIYFVNADDEEEEEEDDKDNMQVSSRFSIHIAFAIIGFSILINISRSTIIST